MKIPGKSSKAAAITDKELAMAMALVEGMADDWKPDQYHDTYREDILALIEKKVKAKDTKSITMPDKDSPKPASSNVVDLVALLQASIGKKPGAKAAPAKEALPPKKAKKPAAKAAAKAPARRKKAA